MRLRKFFRRAFTGGILACVAVTAAAQFPGELQVADDLAAAASQTHERRIPIMIAFTQSGCGYRDIPKRDYLIPMQGTSDLRSKVIIREIDVDGLRVLSDFAGRRITHRDFAKRYNAKKVPTVIVVDGNGRTVALPIVGLLAEGFNRLHPGHAIDHGQRSLRATSGH